MMMMMVMMMNMMVMNMMVMNMSTRGLVSAMKNGRGLTTMKIWGTGGTAGSGLTRAFAWRSYTTPTSIVTLRTGLRNGGGSTRTGVGMSY